jgi:AcrR family transcriptional regulator
MSAVGTTPERERGLELQRAAAELFFAKGYEATTIREIAQALRMKSASIYYHYDSKEQILFELIRSTMEQLAAGVRRVLDGETSPDRQLAGLVVHHVVMHALRPKETTLGETELRSLTGERRERVLRMRDEYEGLVVRVLDEGARAGLFRLLDVKLSAYAVIAQCTNVGIWFRPGGRLALDDVAHVYVNLALRIAGGPAVRREAVARLAAAAQAFHEELR